MQRRSPVRASQPRKGRGRLFNLTIFLSVLSILTLGIGVLTFAQANRLMRQPGHPMKPYTANAMPQYMPVSFLSGDEQSQLSGWFFSGASGSGSTTVILIHPHHSNRAPFADATGRLIFRLNEGGYNVLTFDQRHAGDSGGALTTYGYAEWQDVIGAISAAHRITGSANCVLYGIGSGVTAALKAWNHLPENAGRNSSSLPFGRSAVKAMILDTPLPNSDDYIRQDVICSGVFAHQLTRYTVPLAVRLTAELSKPVDIQAETGSLPMPILLIKSSQPAFSTHEQDRVITARMNVQPARTRVYEAPAEADTPAQAAETGQDESAGEPQAEAGSYRPDPEGYTQSLLEFLKTFTG